MIHGYVFARGGSKGVSRKNVRLLDGLPLVAYSVMAAKRSGFIDRIFCSTDDMEIAYIANQFGADIIHRPPELARDDSPEIEAWRHALEATAPCDVFVSVPCTCPLRTPGDIDATVEALDQSGADLAVTVTPCDKNPLYVAVTLAEGRVKPLANPPVRRQDAPVIHNIVGAAYAARPEYVRKTRGFWDGKIVGVEIPRERAVDIDTELDFRLAELLMKEKANA